MSRHEELNGNLDVEVHCGEPCLTKLTQAMKLFAASPLHSCLYTSLISMQRQPSPQLTRVVLAPLNRDTAPGTRLCEYD